MTSKSYQDLEVWQRAMDVVVECYRVTQAFPKSEVYGLTNQLQRAAVSIPANIAEGQGRQYDSEFIQFLYVAPGSLTELETHIQIAARLNYLASSEANHLLAKTGEVGRLLNGLIRFLRSKTQNK
ncbi:MAG: four helix bundle protein [Acidobacteriota bacterium]